MNQMKFVKNDVSLHVWSEYNIHIFDIKSGFKQREINLDLNIYEKICAVQQKDDIMVQIAAKAGNRLAIFLPSNQDITTSMSYSEGSQVLISSDQQKISMISESHQKLIGLSGGVQDDVSHLQGFKVKHHFTIEGVVYYICFRLGRWYLKSSTSANF